MGERKMEGERERDETKRERKRSKSAATHFPRQKPRPVNISKGIKHTVLLVFLEAKGHIRRKGSVLFVCGHLELTRCVGIRADGHPHFRCVGKLGRDDIIARERDLRICSFAVKSISCLL